MHAGPFHGRRETGELIWSEREWLLEEQWVTSPLGIKEGGRDGGNIAFFAAEACPECGIDHCLDISDRGRVRRAGLTVFVWRAALETRINQL
jgi:hypothetical protein